MLFSSMLLMIGILKYDLMDLASVTKDYIIDELTSGVIVLDQKNEPVYHNRKTSEVFPQIENDTEEVISQIRGSIKTGEPVTVKDRSYTFEEKDR